MEKSWFDKFGEGLTSVTGTIASSGDNILSTWGKFDKVFNSEEDKQTSTSEDLTPQVVSNPNSQNMEIVNYVKNPIFIAGAFVLILALIVLKRR
jgi:hypothetical protein